MPLASLSAAQRERALAKLLPHNAVLALLSQEVRDRLLPHLALADLPVRHQLGDSGGRFARAFFPVAGVVSLVYPAAADGGCIAALVGSEGLVGLPMFMGESARTRATVQCAGYGLALGREQLLEEWARRGSFTRVLMRYGRALATQMSLLAACRRTHSLEQQLCSLLRMCLQRLAGQDLMLREDTLARLLGVSPVELTAAVDRLSERGLPVARRQGVLTVQDNETLRQVACSCSERIGSEYAHRLAAAGLTTQAAASRHAAEPAPVRPWREALMARSGIERPHSR